MDLDDLPGIGSVVSFEEVNALSQKRIMTFFNEFVSHTVTFLNKFSSDCEEKLFEVDTILEKLETMLSILEAKLSSVPGLATAPKTEAIPSTTGPASSPSSDPSAAPKTNSSQPAAAPAKTIQSEPATSAASQSESAAMVCLRQTEPYRRYFRMLEVGVPEPAVRLKLQQDGLDPDLLQRGGELVPLPQAESDREDSDAASWSSGGS